ncbi:MoxR family ATPase [Jatrophihabitans sp.]|uniref:AAA family ATPase n=1 Tax=Jatrophihabitans sp. TaxID=1932789 RepID=UPI0030C67053|nr:nirQ [Jatrophihabitans sp.]
MTTSHPARPSVTAVRARVAADVVGREREIDLVLAAVAAGRNLLLEGPPGTSKTTLLHAITGTWGIPLMFVEGNADLTPARLIGHHNPARVLREDYSADNFVDGPLLTAMRTGGFLYVEELNRAPDDTLNTLLTAMADRRITVPRVGTIAAEDTFRVVASMNPFDNVGTTRLSTSVHDRLCRISLTYQDEQAEHEIVRRRAGMAAHLPAEVLAALHFDAVQLTRATRRHDDIRQGSSVRGAIDLALVGAELLAMRGIVTEGPPGARAVPEEPERLAYAETVFDATAVALSGRIHLDDTLGATAENVLRSIWTDHFVLGPSLAEPG